MLDQTFGRALPWPGWPPARAGPWTRKGCPAGRPTATSSLAAACSAREGSARGNPRHQGGAAPRWESAAEPAFTPVENGQVAVDCPGGEAGPAGQWATMGEGHLIGLCLTMKVCRLLS